MTVAVSGGCVSCVYYMRRLNVQPPHDENGLRAHVENKRRKHKRGDGLWPIRLRKKWS